MNINFSAEAVNRAKRANTYAHLAYQIITGSECSAKHSIAAGYISCAFSYACQAKSILFVHPEADTNGLFAYLDMFEDFVDAALAVLNGKEDANFLDIAYSAIENFFDNPKKSN